MRQVLETLQLLKERFRHVFFVPGVLGLPYLVPGVCEGRIRPNARDLKSCGKEWVSWKMETVSFLFNPK